MRSSFSRCGRYAFARGNSSWARQFNYSLHSARASNPASFPMSPSTWRILTGATPILSSKLSVMMAASESPAATGFAEQQGCSQSGMMSFGSSDSDDVAEGDETTDVISSAPAGSHVCLLKSMSDVIVFGTNICSCNMKCIQWSREP